MINLYAFADEVGRDLQMQIEAMRRNGLDGLEIRAVDEFKASALPELPMEKAREIKARLDGNGLRVFSVGSPIGKIKLDDPFEPHLDAFKRTLELAHCLGAENLRLFSFLTGGVYDGDAVLERLRRFADAGKDTGIVLCHENEKGIFGDNAERCLLILQNIPELKAVFDPANFVQCGQDTLEAYNMLKPYIHYMHIKDALPDGTVVPAGQGAGNVAYIARDLIKNGKCNFTLEPHLPIFHEQAEEDRKRLAGLTYPDRDSAFDTAAKAFDAITGRQEKRNG